LRKAFNWKTKIKISEFIVLETPQDHSFFVTLKRTYTSMIFSIFTVFTFYDPVSKLIQGILFPGVILQPFDQSKPVDLVIYCMIFLLTFSILTVTSFFLFFWLLPTSFLLDDAGVACYTKYMKRRAPPEIKSVSNWFLSMMTSIVGTGAIVAYIYFILNNSSIVFFIQSQLGSFPAVEFSIFFLGFPFFGTILMSYILLLFQESQFNKLKTFVYQELISIKIDPRIVRIKLFRDNTFQDRSLLDYPGENIKHNPSLQESASNLSTSGELDENELVKK